MKTIYKFSLLIVINFFFLSTINAQSSNCDATVPTMFANLSGNNDSVWISPLINRLGRCCGTSNPDVCLRFIITLDTDVAGIQFNIASGAIPGGSMFYQIDCGPQVAVGSPICMTSGTHELTFCKPGNNSNTYSITSVPKPNISVVPVQNQCSDAIQIDGLVSSSITINSVYPGSYGQYNNYLNCQFGCNYSEVNAIGSTPEYIDYVVCGNVLLPECSENSIFCDTVRIHFVDNLNTSLSTNSIFPCSPLDTAKLIGNFYGGMPPYTWFWTDNINGTGNMITTDSIANITTTGIFSFVVRDSRYPRCNQKILNISVSMPSSLLNTTLQSTTNVNCFAEANGAIDINVNGGTTPYNYNWNNGATSQDITNLTANNYQVTITDANGCSTSIAATISQPNAPLYATIQSTTNVNCFAEANGAIDINVNGGTTPYNYNWNNGATSQDITNLTANNYQVTITDANGCSTSIATTISQPNAPLNANTAKENPKCYGASDGSATIVVTGGTDPYNYTWNNSLSSPQLTQISSGEYSVTVTDANGCSIIRSILLTDPQPISIYSVQTPTTCNNDNGTIVLTVNGGTPGYTYHWSENYTGMHTSTITGLSNNTYTVTVTDANGCSESVSTNVEKILPPNLILASQTNESCSNSNGSIIVAVVNGTAPFHYNWNINSNTNTNFRNSLQAGHYFVIVTDQEGCKDTLYSNIINHEAPSIAVLSTTPSHCSQPDGAINILVTGGSNNYQYHWSTNATSSNITQLTPGNYSVTVTDGYCSVSEFISISNTSSPKASLSVNRFHALLSDASFIFSNLSTNYTSCIWDFGDNTTSTLDNPTHVYSNYGVYTVTLTVLDEFGCSSTESLIVNVTTELIVWVPNTFTPNGDGVNENFGPIATGYSPEGYHLFIYDRWGQKVFESKDYGDRWEGNIKEDSINSSYVYSWILVIYDLQGKPYKFKGNVTLLGAN